MKTLISTLLICLTFSTFAQTKLSVDKVKYKLSKDASKNGSFVFSEIATTGEHVHSFYQYQARKKKDRGRQFIDVASYNIASGNIEIETVAKGTDLVTQFNLTPLTNDEISGILKASATSAKPPTEVVEFSGIKLFAREGRLEGGVVGALEYEKTGSKIRLQDGFEDFISPILVHPVDEDFSSYYHRINLNTGFFARVTNYAIVAKGSKAFVLGTIQGSLFAGVFNTEKMDYDNRGMVKLSNTFYEVIEYDIDPIKKQVKLLFTTSIENPKIVSAILDLKTAKVLEETAITPVLEGIQNVKRNNLIQDGANQYVAIFTDVPKNNPNWGKNRLASFKLIKLSSQNSWDKEYSLEELSNKVVSAPGETKKTKFHKKGTEGAIDKIMKVGDHLIVQGYFILGGADISVHGNSVTSRGKRKTFIAQLNPQNGDMVAFYQFDDLKVKKKDLEYATAYNTERGKNISPVISKVNDDEVVLTIRRMVKGAGVHSSTSGNVTTTYRLVNDYGWVKLHKLNLNAKAASKSFSLTGHKNNVVVQNEPIVLSDGTVLIDAQSSIMPGRKTKFTKYIIQ